MSTDARPPGGRGAGAEDHLLTADGRSVAVRPTRTDDRDAVTALVDGLSPASRAMRFGAARAGLRAEEAAAIAAPPGPEGVALIALAGADRDEAVAVARYDRRPGEGQAELSLAVADAWQGLGLGTGLIERLLEHGRHDGVDALWALVLPANRRMLEVFRHLGCQVEQEIAPGEVIVRLSTQIDDGLEDAAIDRFAGAAAASMEPVMLPRSIALVGASRDPASVGGAVLESLLARRSTVRVTPVNRSAAAVAGRPAVPSLTEVDGPVDLAIVAVPAPGVPAVAREAARRGVRGLVVLSSGFSEAGPAGAALEEELLHVARAAGVRLVGPNCLGLWSGAEATGFDATFAPAAPPGGSIALASQSGGLGLAAFAHCARRGIGLSAFASLGNAADVSATDLLAWWERDERTRVVLLYLEGFGDPRRFARLARRVCRSTPVVALKAGRGPAGRRGGGSHTAALAADEPSADALFDLAGIVRVETLEELLEAGELIAGQPLPGGRRVAILSNVGGPGILAADACEGHGLEVPALSAGLGESLAAAVPSIAGASNPVDLGAAARPEDLLLAGRLIAESGEVDALIVVAAPLRGRDGAALRGAAGLLADAGVTVAGCSCGVEVASPSADDGRVVPWMTFPENAARAVAHAARAGAHARRPPDPPERPPGLDRAAARRLLQEAPEGSWLAPDAVAALLGAYGIAMPRARLASSPEQAAAAQAELGAPVAVKVARPVVPHKSEVGGVRLGCGTPAAAAGAFREMDAALRRSGACDGVEAVVVQEMVGDGVELIVGSTDDEVFGPLVLAGIGGVEAELWADRAVALAPIGRGTAGELWRGLRGSAQLDGWRGAPGADRTTLADLVTRVAWLAADQPLLAELDCNPVRAPMGERALVLDARALRAPAPS
jgi:acyl-CoA synthetase (NDP forming)/GNAT superfamily N-acetyltransferase